MLNAKIPAVYKPQFEKPKNKLLNWFKGLFKLLPLIILFSCVEHKSIDLEEEVRQYRAIKKYTLVTGVYLESCSKCQDHIEVRTQAEITFRTYDNRIDKYHEGDTIYYYVDRKTGKLLGNILP